MPVRDDLASLLRGLLRSSGTVSEKAVRSGVWVILGRLAGRVLTLARTVVLARLLSPDDFGLFAIALLGLSLLETISQTGFEAALIHRSDDDVAKYLDTAWVVQIGRNCLLALLLVLSAPVIAAFFREPQAGPLLRLVAVGLFLRGFSNIGVVYLQKDLEFRRQTVFQLITSLADVTVSIAAGIVLRNAWALAWGFVAAQLARSIASFLVHPHRSHFRFDRRLALELGRFGKWVFSTRVLNYLVQSLDAAVVGRMLQATSLGLYNMASRLSGMAATEVTHVVSQVTFPAFAKVRDDRERLRAAVFRTLGLVSTVSLPVAGGLLILAPQIVRTVLGEQWTPMIPAFQLLLVSGAVRSLTANFGSLFLAAGRPDIQTKASFLNIVVLGLTLVPLVASFGILGAVYARLLTLVTQLYTWPRFLRLTGVRLAEVARMLASPTAAAIVAAFAVRALRVRGLVSGMPELVLLAVIGAVLYVIVLWLLDRLLSSGHRENFRHVLRLLAQSGT